MRLRHLLGTGDYYCTGTVILQSLSWTPYEIGLERHSTAFQSYLDATGGRYR